ncbi:hypothetical protein ATE84_3989 [Aquimarina sp. MAR_2010_214]|uniref:hypothetical protein n=1 Tax=Aquimarina sp. MAR_2010_214 TaxID=1250026 RepID=UPI000C70CD7E|nr:hypothetical protein [Aquimarina sp. MAR_2010_214]PKV51889.1 hypothetical protein ATE84_3989 [Aquimarina sp. MAR_2010_214]
MELINVLKVNENSILFEYYETRINQSLLNSHTTEANIYRFSNPENGTEEDRFIMMYSGNIQSNLETQIAHYIFQKQDERTMYIIRSDRFNIDLELVK